MNNNNELKANGNNNANPGDEIAISIIEWIIQLLPVIAMIMIQFFSKGNVNITNADYLSSLIQITMVCSAVYMTLQKDNSTRDILIYSLILFVSCILFTMIQTKSIPDIENDMGLRVAIVVVLMFSACFGLRIFKCFQKKG